MPEAQYPIINNKAKMQLETEVDGMQAILVYRFYLGNIALMHTEVPDALGGKGIATALAVAAFDFARQEKQMVVNYCPFVEEFLKKHTEYRKQLNPEFGIDE